MKPHLLLVLPALSAFLAAAPTNATGRERLRFDDGWKFHLADDGHGHAARGRDGHQRCAFAETLALASSPSKLPAAENPGCRPQPTFNDSALGRARVHPRDLITTENTCVRLVSRRCCLPPTPARKTACTSRARTTTPAVYSQRSQLLARHSGWDEPFDVPLGPGVEGRRPQRARRPGGERRTASRRSGRRLPARPRPGRVRQRR